jgi:hypothetical protein
MQVNSLIIEQLDSNGTLKTFKIQADSSRELVVAFADEFEEPREGPFYFLDEHYAKSFARGFAECKSHSLGRRCFRDFSKNNYQFSHIWRGIPTKRSEVSFYSLSLPEYAILKYIQIIDPQNPSHEFKRSIVRDEQKKRFQIYLECRSKHGLFNFDLNCNFMIDALNFPLAEYRDSFSNNDGYQNFVHFVLQPKEEEKVKRFFIKTEKLSLYNMPNSQFAGGIVDAETVQSQQIGGEIYNTDNQEHPD